MNLIIQEEACDYVLLTETMLFAVFFQEKKVVSRSKKAYQQYKNVYCTKNVLHILRIISFFILTQHDVLNSKSKQLDVGFSNQC